MHLASCLPRTEQYTGPNRTRDVAVDLWWHRRPELIILFSPTIQAPQHNNHIRLHHHRNPSQHTLIRISVCVTRPSPLLPLPPHPYLSTSDHHSAPNISAGVSKQMGLQQQQRRSRLYYSESLSHSPTSQMMCVIYCIWISRVGYAVSLKQYEVAWDQ